MLVAGDNKGTATITCPDGKEVFPSINEFSVDVNIIVEFPVFSRGFVRTALIAEKDLSTS